MNVRCEEKNEEGEGGPIRQMCRGEETEVGYTTRTPLFVYRCLHLAGGGSSGSRRSHTRPDRGPRVSRGRRTDGGRKLEVP